MNRIAVNIIILFMVSNLSAGLAISNINLNIENNVVILFVGGTGPGNYTSIQDAINDASDGDTVFVFPGTYHQMSPLLIDKSIKLIGENRDAVIIESETQSELAIRSNYVLINNFTFKNLCVTNYHDNVNIHYNFFINDNEFSQYGHAIIHSAGSNNMISDNNILFINYTEGKHPSFGLSLREYNSNIINNKISGGFAGMSIDDEHDSNRIKGLNTIKGNIISKNTVGLFFYPCIQSSYQKSRIVCNDFIDNGIHASFTYGIPSILDIIDFVQDDEKSSEKNPIELSTSKERGFFSSCWDGNYWDEENEPYPKIIHGRIYIGGIADIFHFTVPWVNFDWNPAEIPNSI